MKPTLPPPSDEALVNSHNLFNHIQDIIQEHGPISFYDYMQRVLYTPGLGYYSGGSTKIGSNGDFITAPELSAAFAKCLAKQCQQIIANIDTPIIIELGAGLGTLAAGILLELEAMQSLPKEYWILEPSADLQSRQYEYLTTHCPHLINKVRWLQSLPNKDFDGIILGNEIIDALAVNRFKIRDKKIIELGVDFKDNVLQWAELSEPHPILNQTVKKIEAEYGPFPDSYCSEINLYLTDWLKAVTQHLNQGLVIFIDYGYNGDSYYHFSRRSGTLMCYYRHHAHEDPFLYPGLQDITAHVDFTALALAGLQANLNLAGYANQGMFLLNCGLAEHLAYEHDISKRARIKQLIMPEHMGESFKIMAFTRHLEIDLMGFMGVDQRHKLSLL